MEEWLELAEMFRRERGERFPLPVPVGRLSNGELPARRDEGQRLLGRRLLELADLFSTRLRMDRREFLATSCGLVTAFLAINSIHGPLFAVSAAEAADPDLALQSRNAHSRQFIFDVQTHFVSDLYKGSSLLGLRRSARQWNPALKGEKTTLEKIRFGTFIKEVFLESDTTLALLSSAPHDRADKWFLNNDEIFRARKGFNEKAGSKRLFSHALFTPGMPGWLEEMDRAISELSPDSWKGYTVGAPSTISEFPWRLDDEKLVYPAYERMVKAGILNVCIHKGLIHPAVKAVPGSTWRYGRVDDVGKAARDWPQLNFIIYHAGIETLGEPSKKALRLFEQKGAIPWVSELAGIPERYGVKNVYGELGSVFAASALAKPRYCAAILGTLVKGLGADHLLWGTDSVWYGSPQWQIEAFRRIEIPEEMGRKWGFAPLGEAGGQVKSAILGGNARRLYNLPAAAERPADRVSQLKERYGA
ncbi:MAG: amidohydrolase family protein [Deltaproteobacteria bacterium]|nr:amidohydrolase family protein [Deltaproteobacteria bacterium]